MANTKKRKPTYVKVKAWFIITGEGTIAADQSRRQLLADFDGYGYKTYPCTITIESKYLKGGNNGKDV